VIRLATLPLAERLILGRDVIGVLQLKVERALAGMGEVFELVIAQWLHGLPSDTA